MSNIKLGEPIPKGIPEAFVDASENMENLTQAAVDPVERAADSVKAILPATASFDHLLLFPMKLGLSVALASAAMMVNPMMYARAARAR